MKKITAIIILIALALTPVSAFGYAKMDLTTPSGLTAEELAAGLRKELPKYAESFIEAEEKYGVNAIFLAAVAALESGWGRHCFRENNIFGWSGKDFESKEECIDFVASCLAKNYLSEEGKYYHGKTVSGVNTCYNGSDFWENKIPQIMWMIAKKAYAEKEVIAP